MPIRPTPHLEELQRVPLLSRCSTAQLRSLAATAGEFRVPARWTFLQQGTPAHEFYVVLEGSVRVFRDRTAVADAGEGAVIGEMAYFRGGQRSASVASMAAVRALRVPYDGLADGTLPEVEVALEELSRVRTPIPVQ